MENEKNILNQRNLSDSQTRNQMQSNSLKRSGSQGGLRKLQLNGNYPNPLPFSYYLPNFQKTLPFPNFLCKIFPKLVENTSGAPQHNQVSTNQSHFDSQKTF